MKQDNAMPIDTPQPLSLNESPAVTINDLKWARDDVSASSAGGAPFLIAFGLTLAISGVLYFYVALETAALIAMFQGVVAMPLAFRLERWLSARPMAPDNPLRPLSVQMAMSQVVALPAVIVAFNLSPVTVPVVLAAIGGGHFLPYAWLHRTWLYLALGIAIALGAFGLQVALRSAAFPYVLFYMALVYWLLAPLLYRHARRLPNML